MLAHIKNLSDRKHTSLLVPFVGIATQIVSWPGLFLIGTAAREMPILISIVSGAWFFIPVISLFGIFAGAYYIKKHGWNWSPVTGIMINAIWFICFILFSVIVQSGVLSV